MEENDFLSALNWDEWIDLAMDQAKSDPARANIETWKDPNAWAKDLASAKQRQNESQELLPFVDREAFWGPLNGLSNPVEIIDALRKGAILEVENWCVLREWIYAAVSWSESPLEEIKDGSFRKAVLSLPALRTELTEINRVISPKGDINESASPKYASLNRDVLQLESQIRLVMERLQTEYQKKGILQENFQDVRDGRFVLPVKISLQNQIGGIIQDVSVSKQTVYVEPYEVRHLQERLSKSKNDLIEELFRILTELAKKLQPSADNIEAAVQTLVHWDQVQARTKLSRVYGGKPIQVVKEPVFDLSRTAHPLLWWSIPVENIIRNECNLESPNQSLLLTGPNAGGKTVFLKTIGLAALCARTGFFFPSDQSPKVGFFEKVFVDLGDPQSLEAHLSSFTGHLTKFKDMLENVDSQSLVLIDELNSATDPEEGAALGRAILESLLDRGTCVVATTHDPRLKALAMKDDRIAVASMSFDEESREPSYQVLMGVPGRSRALETAERLGIPENVLTKARSYLDREHQLIEDVLEKLEKDSFQARKAREDAEKTKLEVAELKSQLEVQVKAGAQTLFQKNESKLRELIDQANEELRSTMKKLSIVKTRKEIEQTRDDLNAKFESISSQLQDSIKDAVPEDLRTGINLQKSEEKMKLQLNTLEAGQTVIVPKWKSKATVLSVNGEEVKVAMGAIQMKLHFSELEPAKEEKKKDKGVQVQSASDSPPPPQIDLRGKRLDDALTELTAYLDHAFLSRVYPQVTIVHGLGTGAIREGARKLLANLPYVKTFRDGGPGQGGTGATLVEFEF